MAEESDRQSVELCLDGHPEAYRQLVNRYHGAVLSFLSGRLGRQELVEEACQEAFVRAYFALPRLRKRGAFFSWLLGIAHRCGKELQRQGRRRQELSRAWAGDHAAGRHGETRNSLGQPTDQTTVDDRDLESAVAQLPPVYREVILLRFYSQRSCPQVARELGIPLGTVTKRLSRAYAMLRETLPNPGQDI